MQISFTFNLNSQSGIKTSYNSQSLSKNQQWHDSEYIENNRLLTYLFVIYQARLRIIQRRGLPDITQKDQAVICFSVYHTSTYPILKK